MRTQSIRILGVAAAALAISASPAQAQRSVMQVLRDDPRVQQGQTNRDIERQREIERERQREIERERQRELERARRSDGRIYRDDDGIRRDRDDDDDRDGDRKWKKGKKVPPGLAKKPGQMPPGQYKKMRYETRYGASVLGDYLRRDGYSVLRTIPRDNGQYVYYRTRDGQERRAIVVQGDERLSFSNVPQSVLRQVMAALY